MAQPTSEPLKDSQLLQDFLLDMDFDEFIPVNNFFSGYVQALDVGSHSGVTAAPAGPGPADGSLPMLAGGGVPLPSITPFSEIFPHVEPCASQQPAPLGPPDGVGPASATELLCHPHEAGHVAAAATTPPQQQPHTSGRAGGGANSGNSSEHNNTGAASRSRGRLKTERQQALNKAAQHRYRERKKAKALELEQAVACLKDKVDELQVVQREKEELQAKVDALEEKLVVKAADEVRAAAGAAPDGAAIVDDAALSELVAQYHGNVVALRTFLSRNRYLECVTDAHLKALPRDHAAELEALVQRCFNTCANAHQLMSDADVYSMIEASIDKAQTSFQGSAEHWHHLVASLQLDERTRRSARALRAQYLGRVRDVYAERHALNLQAVRACLPSNVGGLATAPHEEQGNNAYLQRHKESYRTAAVMQRLRANLSAEQRALAEVDFLVYRKLFNALQAARCILTAYPHHCDVLSLLNALQGEQDAA